MVEYEHNHEERFCVCTTDKLKTKVFIEKSLGGNIFFNFRFEKGMVPKELSGSYTSIDKAKIALENYLRKKPKSKTVLRDEYADMREKQRNATKSKSEGS